MKTNKTMQRLLLTAAVVSALAAVTAKAQYLNTFDNSGSVLGRLETYSSASSTLATSWSSLDANNNPSSGSELMAIGLHTTADGTAIAPITFDLVYPAQNISDLSFDLMVGAGSASDLYGGYGDFSVATRLTDNYNFNGVYDTELGPNWGLTLTPGQWVHIDIPLTTATGTALRAITLQEYSGSDRNINGTVNLYIDNLSLTPVPEPSTIALAGLGLAGLLFVRRNRS